LEVCDKEIIIVVKFRMDDGDGSDKECFEIKMVDECSTVHECGSSET